MRIHCYAMEKNDQHIIQNVYFCFTWKKVLNDMMVSKWRFNNLNFNIVTLIEMLFQPSLCLCQKKTKQQKKKQWWLNYKLGYFHLIITAIQQSGLYHKGLN